MQLAPSIQQELVTAIEGAVHSGRPFPLDICSEGVFTHKISKEKIPGNLITTIDQGGETYLIYLVKNES